MHGEIDDVIRKKKNGEIVKTKKGKLTRVAYSPSIGKREDRRARLIALMAGAIPLPLPRRPQPFNPNQSRSKKDEPVKPTPAPGEGDSIGNTSSSSVRSAGAMNDRDYARRLAKHNDEYVPSFERDPAARERLRSQQYSDDEILFPKKR